MEFKNGTVSLSNAEIENMCDNGFEFSRHTESYLNFLGVRLDEFEICLSGWQDGLNAYVGTNEIKINNVDEFNTFINMIESAVLVKTTFKSIL